jgi:hypothetical protein
MGLRKQAKEIRKLFLTLGYVPREIFNALQGGTRLIFQDNEYQRRIDIFLDVFEMCHRLDLRTRIQLDEMTIPLAYLLFTKLQVVEITEREYKDIIALIHDHEIGDSDERELINGRYLARLCAEDWGVYKTLTINIANVLNVITQFDLETGDEKMVQDRLENILNMIERFPKGIKWKARARIGEKVRWYELPEADKKIVNTHTGVSSGTTLE